MKNITEGTVRDVTEVVRSGQAETGITLKVHTEVF